MKYSKEDYKEMDYLTNAVLVNLFTLSKNSNNEVNFDRINFNDKAHLCVLKIAEQMRAFSDVSVNVGKTNLIRLFFYNWKKKEKIKIAKIGYIDYIQMEDLINFTCRGQENGRQMLEAAYDCFFNIKKGKKNDL